MEGLLQTLIKSLPETYSKTDQEKIVSAFEFAESAHKGQMRLSGQPFITHSVGTARLLAEWRLSPNIVTAGLLHDVPEDTTFTIADIENKFGQDVAKIVEGETKLDRVKYHGSERYAENLRRMFMAIAKDIRVIFVKFADRLHNLETLNALPEPKKKRVANETLEIYAPIANRLGMGEIKGILEDLSFPYVFPSEHKWLLDLVADKFEQKKEQLKKIKAVIENVMVTSNINFSSIHGRTKHLYSLYKKLLKYDRDITKIYDLVALRIIVNNVADCYATLGVIHNRFKPLKGRVKDYISQPKPNGYQSLHTTIFCDDGEIVEFQIRTKEMHEDAEYGVAAHWRYEEHGKEAPKTYMRTKWLDELALIQKELHNRRTFLETLEELKIDMFQNRIFVFTPKGDVLDLPEESTPVDFAFAIHSEVGDHCSSAIINGEFAPLNTKLNSGDIVEIITSDKRKGPAGDWIKFVKTKNAKDRINAYSRRSVTKWLQNIIAKK